MSSLTEKRIQELEEIARNIRADSLKFIHHRGAGHPGGALSSADILSVLYFEVLKLDPKNPQWEARDRFILSKGHASAALYAALSRRGFFDAAELEHWGEVDCPHQGHPDRFKTPGVEMTSGILGHGVAIGAGLALAARLNRNPSRTYVLLGDGECQAGVVWEGAAMAGKYRLNSLVVIVDMNDVQLDGPVHEIMPMERLAERWKVCGWSVIEINGHDVRQVYDALQLAKEIHDKPVCIAARTTKGKGVSFMENDCYWHGNVPNQEQLAQALAELGMEGR